MRPVARPPWDPRWAALSASHAAAAALGGYCSACEIPLLYRRVAWNASTGEVVPGRARPEDWDDLLVLCPHCAQAAEGQVPGGHVLLPDRDDTFALGPGAPFGHELRIVEVAGTDGGEPDVAERIFVVPNGDAAAGTVQLFGLNTAQQVDSRLRLALDADPAELPLTGEQRRELTELDDPRLMLRTEALQNARDTAMAYRQLTGDAARASWARLAAHAIRSQGFWSVWAAVLAEVDLPLATSALGLPHGPADPAAPGHRRPVAVAARAFKATRAGWLPPSSPTTEQD
jgi:hypothetical protein